MKIFMTDAMIIIQITTVILKFIIERTNSIMMLPTMMWTTTVSSAV